ncbi:MAG: hypothetical protein H6867_03480 [Rhodospirillales bacterium]|nr:hypothetical protein [Rhodospirillales bacterium]
MPPTQRQQTRSTCNPPPPVLRPPRPPLAEFSLTDADILAWEESGEGKYIYFTLTEEKNTELATITTEHLGQAIQINLNDNFIIIPKVTTIMDQQNGFVLNAAKEKRFEIIRMLDPDKKKASGTEISLHAGPMPDPAATEPPAEMVKETRMTHFLDRVTTDDEKVICQTRLHWIYILSGFCWLVSLSSGRILS